MTISFKKIIAYILVCSFILSNCVVINAYTGDGVKMENGVITFWATTKKATSGIKYRTVGWIIHTQPSLNCDPKKTGGSYIEVMDFRETESIDAGNDQLLTVFTLSEQSLVSKLAGTALETYQNGKTIYMSSIYAVVINGVEQSKKYYSYAEIAAAQSWSNPEDLKKLYDKPIKFDMPKQPVDKIYEINGKRITISQETADMGSSKSVPLDKTYVYNGTTYELDSSFLEYKTTGKVSYEQGSSTITRNFTIPVGGINVVAKYVKNTPTTPTPTPDPEPSAPPSTGNSPVYRIEMANGTQQSKITVGTYKEGESVRIPLRTNISVGGTTYTLKKSTIQVVGSSELMEVGPEYTERNITAAKGGVNVIAYYEVYTPGGGGGGGGSIPTPEPSDDVTADLELSASPSSVVEGESATVSFTLDASGSYADNTIVEYEWWLSDTRSGLNGSPDDYSDRPYDWTSITLNNVRAGETYYAKVRVTTNGGNSDEATASIYIKAGKKPPLVTLNIDKKLYVRGQSALFNTSYEDGGTRYTISNKYWEICNYETGWDSIEGTGNIPSSVILNLPPARYEAKQYIEWYDADGDKQSTYAIVLFDVVNPLPPEVHLTTDKSSYHVQESIYFTPEYVTDEPFTFPITKKTWVIKDANGQVVSSGTGDIVNSYKYHLHSDDGTYSAEQTIYYTDTIKGIEGSATATVSYYIKGLIPPEVYIETAKPIYHTPMNGTFISTYITDAYSRFPIDKKTWVLKNSSGKVINQGNGDFPSIVDFHLTYQPDDYVAEQTIYYTKKGVQSAITANVRFKVIKPIPEAVFNVKMKLDTLENWRDVVFGGFEGKQFRQIRIDLSSSTIRNNELGYPWPIQYTANNNPTSLGASQGLVFPYTETQIKIVPLSSSLQANYGDNDKIVTFYMNNIAIESNEVTIKGKDFIDVRFDKPGRYRIKVKVTNGFYESPVVVKDIEIREDLPPIINMTFEGVTQSNGKYLTTRGENLSTSFKVLTSVTMQDDDLPNYNSAKMYINFDNNSNGNFSDDGVHSNMNISIATNSVQPYVNVNSKNSTLSNVDLTFNSLSNLILLGDIKFEYTIGKTPTIPYYEGGDMPQISYRVGTTYGLEQSKKVVFVDNSEPVVNVTIGKEGIYEFMLYMVNNTALNADPKAVELINSLHSNYGENIKIYLKDKNGIVTPYQPTNK